MKRLKHPIFGTVIPVGRVAEVPVPHPERTMIRSLGWDAELAEWPSRGAMRQAARMVRAGQSLVGSWQPYRKEDR